MRKLLHFSLACTVLVMAAAGVAAADPYGDMAKVQKAFYHIHSFRGTISSRRLKSPIKMEFVAPDRYHVVTPAGDQYIIGNTMTMHVGGMSMKVPLGATQGMLTNVRSFAANEDLKKDYTIKYLGTTNEGGQTLRIYSYAKSSNPSLTMKMFVGPDNLPRRNEVTDSNGTTTVTYSDYNAPITIQP